ncbi:MAG TPA: GMC family oxidoreductase [Solirubrobacterales bacterium]|nr:GMC family oxidoreductase [Solirubrobacterales bacterium]
MAPLSKTDVVIIGMGAVGGVVADVLTAAGLEVVGLEAGPRLEKADFLKRLDEIGESFSIRNSLGGPKFNREIPTWRPKASEPTQPVPAVGMANCVGGSSVHYGAQFWRFLEDDFTVASSTAKKYGKGALPKGASVVDWPMSYQELEPYYDKVEWQLGVSGKKGANPYEAPRSRDYPMPPLRAAGFPASMAETMAGMGLHPFEQPAAINSEIFNERPPCSFCGFCGYGFGCWNDSKTSTLVTSIPRAEESGHLDLRPNSRVLEITVDSQGNASGVKYLDEKGKEQVQPARFVVLCTYIYENNRLLLLSRSKAFPKGLSNNHGQVGKYYRPQVGTTINGLYAGKQLNIWAGTSGQTYCIDDYNGDAFDHKGLGFIRGASVQVSTNGMPIGNSVNVPPGVPLWGSRYKRWIHENAGSVAGLFAQMESLSYEANFVDLDPVVKDDLGIPVLRLTYSAYENEERMAEYLTEKLTAIHKEAGAKETWGGISVAPIYSHAYGGTRMGDDPETNVVDKYGVSHEVPNLAVMGGSTFVSVSGYNPTEHMQALAWYGAQHIADDFESLAV